MKISVCMIVKNEEKCLANALANLGVFDEVCILDTGSTDKTMDIAREHGCLVVSGGDAMNKGLSRNQIMDLSSGDYCIILDADEIIQNPEAVRKEIEKTQADIYYIRLSFMDDDKPTLTYSQARIFKKGKAYYKYRAHEVPVWDPKARVIWTDLIWEHRPPAERMNDKKIYALERLILDVKENPGEARPLFYLGRQFYYVSQYQAAIDHLQKYIGMGNNYDTADAFYYQALSYKELNNTQKAIQSIYQAIAIKPKQREYWSLLSEIYKDDNQLDLAYSALRFIEKLPPPSHDYYWQKYYGAEFYDNLAMRAYYADDYETALSVGIQAVKLSNDPRIKKNLEYYIQKAGN